MILFIWKARVQRLDTCEKIILFEPGERFCKNTMLRYSWMFA